MKNLFLVFAIMAWFSFSIAGHNHIWHGSESQQQQGTQGVQQQDSEDIEVDQLPQAIQNRVQREFRGANIESAERTRTQDGETLYKVKIDTQDQGEVTKKFHSDGREYQDEDHGDQRPGREYQRGPQVQEPAQQQDQRREGEHRTPRQTRQQRTQQQADQFQHLGDGEEVEMENLPRAVQDKLRQDFGEDNIESVERVRTEDGLTLYKVTVEAREETHVFHADGREYQVEERGFQRESQRRDQRERQRDDRRGGPIADEQQTTPRGTPQQGTQQEQQRARQQAGDVRGEVEEINEGDLPDPVQDAIDRDFPDASVERAERFLNQQGESIYRVYIDTDDRGEVVRSYYTDGRTYQDDQMQPGQQRPMQQDRDQQMDRDDDQQLDRQPQQQGQQGMQQDRTRTDQQQGQQGLQQDRQPQDQMQQDRQRQMGQQDPMALYDQMGDAEQVNVNDLPERIQDRLQAEFEDVNIESAERKRSQMGETVYKISVDDDGETAVRLFHEDGRYFQPGQQQGQQDQQERRQRPDQLQQQDRQQQQQQQDRQRDDQMQQDPQRHDQQMDRQRDNDQQPEGQRQQQQTQQGIQQDRTRTDQQQGQQGMQQDRTGMDQQGQRQMGQQDPLAMYEQMGDAEQVNENDLPERIQNRLQAEFDDVNIESAERKRSQQGENVYKVTVDDNGETAVRLFYEDGRYFQPGQMQQQDRQRQDQMQQDRQRQDQMDRQRDDQQMDRQRDDQQMDRQRDDQQMDRQRDDQQIERQRDDDQVDRTRTDQFGDGEEIDENDLPDAIQTRLESEFDSGDVESVERITHQGQTLYRVTIEDDDRGVVTRIYHSDGREYQDQQMDRQRQDQQQQDRQRDDQMDRQRDDQQERRPGGPWADEQGTMPQQNRPGSQQQQQQQRGQQDMQQQDDQLRDTEEVDADDIPEVIKNRVQREFPGSDIESAEMGTTQRGERVYKVKVDTEQMGEQTRMYHEDGRIYQTHMQQDHYRQDLQRDRMHHDQQQDQMRQDQLDQPRHDRQDREYDQQQQQGRQQHHMQLDHLGEGEEIDQDELPESIQNRLQRDFRDADIESVERVNTRDGQTLYKVKIDTDDQGEVTRVFHSDGREYQDQLQHQDQMQHQDRRRDDQQRGPMVNEQGNLPQQTPRPGQQQQQQRGWQQDQQMQDGEIEVDELPAAVRNRIQTEFRDAEIETVEREVIYKVKIDTPDRGEVTRRFHADGREFENGDDQDFEPGMQPGVPGTPGTTPPGTPPGTQTPPGTPPGTQQPGTQQPGTQQPGTQQPGTQQPGTTPPGTPPGTQQPDDQQPGDQPGTTTPGGTVPPGTQQPGTQPGTHYPPGGGHRGTGADQPGTTPQQPDQFQADAEEIDEDELPEAVRNRIQREFNGAEIEAAERFVNREGLLIYRVTLDTDDQGEIQRSFHSDGREYQDQQMDQQRQDQWQQQDDQRNPDDELEGGPQERPRQQQGTQQQQDRQQQDRQQRYGTQQQRDQRFHDRDSQMFGDAEEINENDLPVPVRHRIQREFRDANVESAEFILLGDDVIYNVTLDMDDMGEITKRFYSDGRSYQEGRGDHWRQDQSPQQLRDDRQRDRDDQDPTVGEQVRDFLFGDPDEINENDLPMALQHRLEREFEDADFESAEYQLSPSGEVIYSVTLDDPDRGEITKKFHADGREFEGDDLRRDDRQRDDQWQDRQRDDQWQDRQQQDRQRYDQQQDRQRYDQQQDRQRQQQTGQRQYLDRDAREINENDLPQAIRHRIQREFQDADVERAEWTIDQNGEVIYSVTLDSDRGEITRRYHSNGREYQQRRQDQQLDRQRQDQRDRQRQDQQQQDRQRQDQWPRDNDQRNQDEFQQGPQERPRQQQDARQQQQPADRDRYDVRDREEINERDLPQAVQHRIQREFRDADVESVHFEVDRDGEVIYHVILETEDRGEVIKQFNADGSSYRTTDRQDHTTRRDLDPRYDRDEDPTLGEQIRDFLFGDPDDLNENDLPMALQHRLDREFEEADFESAEFRLAGDGKVVYSVTYDTPDRGVITKHYVSDGTEYQDDEGLFRDDRRRDDQWQDRQRDEQWQDGQRDDQQQRDQRQRDQQRRTQDRTLGQQVETFLFGDPQEIGENDLPQAIRHRIQREFQDADVERAEWEIVEDGEVIYSVTFDSRDRGEFTRRYHSNGREYREEGMRRDEQRRDQRYDQQRQQRGPSPQQGQQQQQGERPGSPATMQQHERMEHEERPTDPQRGAEGGVQQGQQRGQQGQQPATQQQDQPREGGLEGTRQQEGLQQQEGQRGFERGEAEIINVNQLPEAVQNRIQRDHRGATIESAQRRVLPNGEMIYEINLVTPDEGELTRRYHSDGREYDDR